MTSVGGAPGVNFDTYHSVFDRAFAKDVPVEIIAAEHCAPDEVIEQLTFVGGATSAAFAFAEAEKTKTKVTIIIARNRFIFYILLTLVDISYYLSQAYPVLN